MSAAPPPARQAVLLYLVYCLASIIVLAVFQDRYWLLGDMWGDDATNYFHVAARIPSILEQTLTPDVAGYLAVPQRLIMALVTASLPPQDVPLAINAISIVILSLCGGVFVLPVFRGLVGNDFIRFGVVLLLLPVKSFDILRFINFSYIFVPFLLLSFAVLIADRRQAPRPWMWLAPVMVIAKPVSFAVLPLAALALWKTRTATKALAAAVLAGFALQVYEIVRSTGARPPAPDPGAVTLADRVFEIVDSSAFFAAHLFGAPGRELALGQGLWATLPVLVLATVGIGWLILRVRHPLTVMVFAMLLGIAGPNAMLSVGLIPEQFLAWASGDILPRVFRWTFVQYVALVYLLLALLLLAREWVAATPFGRTRPGTVAGLSAAVAILWTTGITPLFGYLQEGRPYYATAWPDATRGLSMAELRARERLCIAVSPPGWFYVQGACAPRLHALPENRGGELAPGLAHPLQPAEGGQPVTGLMLTFEDVGRDREPFLAEILVADGSGRVLDGRVVEPLPGKPGRLVQFFFAPSLDPSTPLAVRVSTTAVTYVADRSDGPPLVTRVWYIVDTAPGG